MLFARNNKGGKVSCPFREESTLQSDLTPGACLGTVVSAGGEAQSLSYVMGNFPFSSSGAEATR